MIRRRYITAFPGRRDQYQVPTALAENGRLAAFATCFYQGRGLLGRAGALWGRTRAALRARRAPGLDSSIVHCLEWTNLAARIGQRFLQPSLVSVWEDHAFARRATALARRFDSSLILYEFQADAAFRRPRPAGQVRILFQFHPHPALEHPILLADAARHPEFLPGVQRNIRANLGPRYRQHTFDAWRHADHVIVASGFTARSLEAAGCPSNRISVVPYGCEFAEQPPARPPASRPYFLYVGSGSHRKGLHHLLYAWCRSSLPATHDLIVIARHLEPEMRPLLSGHATIRHLGGVSRDALAGWFAGARAFVLPSFSEGFGHVFLEALACGCPVIGTRHSMLPDFAAAQPHVRYVQPGDTAELQRELENVAALPPGDPFFAAAALRPALRSYTWERFRSGLESVLADFDRPLS